MTQQSAPMNQSTTAEEIQAEWERVVPPTTPYLVFQHLFKGIHIDSAKQTHVYAVGGVLVGVVMRIYTLHIKPNMTKESKESAMFELYEYHSNFKGDTSVIEKRVREIANYVTPKFNNR